MKFEILKDWKVAIGGTKAVELKAGQKSVEINDKELIEEGLAGEIIAEEATTPEITEVDYSDYSVEEMLGFAEKAGLAKNIKNPETIAKKLNELGFDPNKKADQE